MLVSMAHQRNKNTKSRLNAVTQNVESSQISLKKMILNIANQQRMKLESMDANLITETYDTRSGEIGEGNQADIQGDRKLTSYPIDTWHTLVTMTSDGADQPLVKDKGFWSDLMANVIGVDQQNKLISEF